MKHVLSTLVLFLFLCIAPKANAFLQVCTNGTLQAGYGGSCNTATQSKELIQIFNGWLGVHPDASNNSLVDTSLPGNSGNAITVGQLLLMTVSSYTNGASIPSITGGAGGVWTQINSTPCESHNDTDVNLYQFWRIATAGDVNGQFLINIGDGQTTAGIISVTGTHTAAPIDNSSYVCVFDIGLGTISTTVSNNQSALMFSDTGYTFPPGIPTPGTWTQETAHTGVPNNSISMQQAISKNINAGLTVGYSDPANFNSQTATTLFAIVAGP